MAATPEIPRSEAQDVSERQEEFIVPETLQTSGIKVVQKTFKTQVTDDKGAPVIQTPPTQVVSVTLPSDPATLATQAKGSTDASLTWLATFWLRVIKKAVHFGWKIIGKEQNVS